MNQPRDVRTIAEVVHFAAKAAAEAYREVFEQSHHDGPAHRAARVAFLANMPTLESSVSVQAYLAVVTRGIELHLVSPSEAKQMIGAARVWLAAERKPSKPAVVASLKAVTA